MQPPGYGPPPGYPAAPGYYYPYPFVPVSPAGIPLADFGSRLLAFVIDTLLVGVVWAIVTFPVIFAVMSSVVPDDPPVNPFSVLVPLFAVEAGAVVFQLLLWYAYAVEIMHRGGQTLGKRIMKIQVIPLDPRLRLTRMHALKRYAVQFLPSVLGGFYILLDDLWPLWDKPFQQSLHDKAAQTVVVKVSA
jgi:uncharacterized RDD family membrane protein YckC